MEPSKRFRPAQDVVFESVADGAVLLSFASSTYYSLNETGAHLWNLLAQRPMSCHALADSVSRAFDVTATACLTDVERVLQTLVEAGLVVEAVEQGRGTSDASGE